MLDSIVYLTLIIHMHISIILENETFKATVIDGYPAEEGNELQLELGEDIMVLNSDDEEWWLGRGKHGVGWFPKDFVKIITDTSASHKQTRLCHTKTNPLMEAVHQSPGSYTVAYFLPYLIYGIQWRISYLNVNLPNCQLPENLNDCSIRVFCYSGCSIRVIEQSSVYKSIGVNLMNYMNTPLPILVQVIDTPLYQVKILVAKMGENLNKIIYSFVSSNKLLLHEARDCTYHY